MPRSHPQPDREVGRRVTAILRLAMAFVNEGFRLLLAHETNTGTVVPNIFCQSRPAVAS
jgi:hypothetical protein